MPSARWVSAVCKRLAELRVPTVAVIAGAVSAGGLELALACDWRVALDQPNTLLGFTELDHGLIPGWGAIGRLSRLIALERCLQMLLGGKKLSRGEALRLGTRGRSGRRGLRRTASRPAPGAKRDAGVPPRRSWRQRLLDATAWGRRLTLRGAERVLRRRLPDDMPAPWAALDVVRTVSSHGAEAGHGEGACRDRPAGSNDRLPKPPAPARAPRRASLCRRIGVSSEKDRYPRRDAARAALDRAGLRARVAKSPCASTTHWLWAWRPCKSPRCWRKMSDAVP